MVSYDTLNREAEGVAIGCEGLVSWEGITLQAWHNHEGVAHEARGWRVKFSEQNCTFGSSAEYSRT